MNKFKVGLSGICLNLMLQLSPHVAQAAEVNPGLFERLFMSQTHTAQTDQEARSFSRKPFADIIAQTAAQIMCLWSWPQLLLKLKVGSIRVLPTMARLA